MSGPLPDVTAGQHRLDTGGQGASEPVVLAHAVTTLLYATAAAGWLVIPDKTIDLIGTVLALVLAVAGTLAARARVSPVGRITWDGVRGVIRAMVYEEIDRLAAAAPALATPAVTADALTAALAAIAEARVPATGPQGTATMPAQGGEV